MSVKPGRSSRDEQSALTERRVRFEVVAHLEELDAVGAPRELDDVKPARVATEEPHGPPPASARPRLTREREAGLLRRAVGEHGVLHRHLQRRVDGLDRDGVHRDQVRKVLLQRALHEELRRGRERAAVRLEDKGQQAGAEVGAHHALAGRGEQHLLDEVADVIGRAGGCGAAAAVEMVGMIQRRHGIGSRQVASTRICAITGSIGVPVSFIAPMPPGQAAWKAGLSPPMR